MKAIFHTGMLMLKTEKYGVQFYCPIITFTKRKMTLSFSTVFVISRKTWQFDWCAGFQTLGIGFGICKYKQENT